MKKVYLLIISFLAVQLFCSCLQNEFEPVLFRTMDDPFNDVPEVDFLSKENTIYLNWKDDDACDEFILLRSVDGAILNFKPVYEGSGVSYIDEVLTDQTKYIYRLDKKRGKMSFTGKEYGFAFSSTVRNDWCEPNDNEQNATLLVSDFECTVPCIKFYTEQFEFLDTDWFCVDVPARRAAEIVIKQKNLTDSGNSSEEQKTDMFFQQPQESPKEIIQDAFFLNNHEFELQRFYCKVYPRKDSLFNADSFSTVIEYTISLNRIIYLEHN